MVIKYVKKELERMSANGNHDLTAAHHASILVLQRTHDGIEGCLIRFVQFWRFELWCCHTCTSSRDGRLLLDRLGHQGLLLQTLDQSLLVHSELDGVDGRARSEVVHTSLKTLLPTVKVHRRDLTCVGV